VNKQKHATGVWGCFLELSTVKVKVYKNVRRFGGWLCFRLEAKERGSAPLKNSSV